MLAKKKKIILIPTLIVTIIMIIGGSIITACVAPKGVNVEPGAVTGVEPSGIVGIEEGAVKVDAKILEELNQTIKEAKQVLTGLINHSEEINNSGTIKYGGAGWVAVGIIGTITVFLAAVIIMYHIRLKNKNQLLGMTTEAIHSCPDHVKSAFKDQINYITSNGGPYEHKHKCQLSAFVKKNGVDA